MTDEDIEEMLRDEDFDISEIYVFENGSLDLSNLDVSDALSRAMKETRRKHKEAGIPMVVWRNGKVVHVQPNEIKV